VQPLFGVVHLNARLILCTEIDREWRYTEIQVATAAYPYVCALIECTDINGPTEFRFTWTHHSGELIFENSTVAIPDSKPSVKRLGSYLNTAVLAQKKLHGMISVTCRINKEIVLTKSFKYLASPFDARASLFDFRA
jgi:hypothetical protein